MVIEVVVWFLMLFDLVFVEQYFVGFVVGQWFVYVCQYFQVVLYGWLFGDFVELVFEVWVVGYFYVLVFLGVQLGEDGDVGD